MEKGKSLLEQYLHPIKTYKEYQSFKQCAEFIEAIKNKEYKFEDQYTSLSKLSYATMMASPLEFSCTDNPKRMGLNDDIAGVYIDSDGGIILLNSSKLKTNKDLERTFLHEMIHVIDDINEPKNIKGFNISQMKEWEFKKSVCSEIRANYYVDCINEKTKVARKNCTLRESLSSIETLYPKVHKPMHVAHTYFEECLDAHWYSVL
mmetsp:Transcript_8754/g.12959  ORF Transcript_8754/g.12959 Transcript_8754/m.12959 type:complete len:205 (+) Transcript_8754:41-655(+)